MRHAHRVRVRGASREREKKPKRKCGDYEPNWYECESGRLC